MKIKPILFSSSMVQAILEDRKTQTRRIIKLPIIENDKYEGGAYIEDENKDRSAVGSDDLPSPFKKGNTLWVRETWKKSLINGRPFIYKADPASENGDGIYGDHKWNPSIHMPKTACRIFLEVTDVRVERLQSIGYRDIHSEGLTGGGLKEWRDLWESINGKDSWKCNPWVWVYDFKRTAKPSNFI